MGISFLGRSRWSLLPEELVALLCPCFAAFRQGFLLLIGHGAARREFRRQRISNSVNGRRGFYLIFVATKPNCTRGNDQDDEHHRRYGG